MRLDGKKKVIVGGLVMELRGFEGFGGEVGGKGWAQRHTENFNIFVVFGVKLWIQMCPKGPDKGFLKIKCFTND